jgi:hypothetical protein
MVLGKSDITINPKYAYDEKQKPINFPDYMYGKMKHNATKKKNDFGLTIAGSNFE